MVKIYTKTGDEGKTYLYDMRRVYKNEDIFELLGSLDELNVWIGTACSTESSISSSIKQELRNLQIKTLEIGSDIATLEKKHNITQITEDDVKFLENKIDYYEKYNKKLTEFILPVVENKDAWIHHCRIKTRQVERALIGLKRTHPEKIDISEPTFKYLNRLSDYFFVLARYISGCQEKTLSQARQNVVSYNKEYIFVGLAITFLAVNKCYQLFFAI